MSEPNGVEEIDASLYEFEEIATEPSLVTEKPMGILAWIVFGLIAGVLAKFIMPGKDPGGIIITILLGVAGAIVGGFLGTLLGFGDLSGFDIRSMALAIGGALVLLFLYRLMKRS